MSSDVALQAMFDRFLGKFVIPLVGEGEVLVSYPLGRGALDYFKFAEPSEGDGKSELMRSRQQVLERLIQEPLPGDLVDDEIDLLAALHNVLLSSHQELVAGLLGGARWRHCLDWALEHLSRVPPCGSPQKAMTRHSLLHQATELTRIDAVVQTRGSTKRYLGQEPPKRVLIWPRFRRVHQSEEHASFPDVVNDAQARLVLTNLLELSPLTCLLNMPYATAPRVHHATLGWSPAFVMVLSRPDLCRAVTYRHLELGLDVVGPYLTDGLLSELRAGVRDDRLVFAMRYLINLQLTLCWTSTIEELEKVTETKWAAEHEETRRFFFGWFAVALARGDRIGAPLPDGELRHRESTYRRAAARAAGQALEEAARQVDLLIPPWQDATTGERD